MAHRDLPSFPTRRSSDLRRGGGGFRPSRGDEPTLRLAGGGRGGGKARSAEAPGLRTGSEAQMKRQRAEQGGRRAERLAALRSEEHTSELQSLAYLVCRLL